MDPHVFISMFRNSLTNNEMTIGSVYGPYPSKAAAIAAKDALDFPHPEWVYVKPLRGDTFV